MISLFVLDHSINSCRLQSVLVDKRPEKTEDPLSGERGPRISQTCHHIGLFLTPSSSSLFLEFCGRCRNELLVFVIGATDMTRTERGPW